MIILALERFGCIHAKPLRYACVKIFCAACDLKHVEVAVAVARIERLDGDRDEEIALPVMTDAFASSGMAGALTLMEWVRDVIGERALVENPLAVDGEKARSRKEQ